MVIVTLVVAVAAAGVVVEVAVTGDDGGSRSGRSGSS